MEVALLSTEPIICEVERLVLAIYSPLLANL